MQTILVPDDRWERYRTSPDWIERYIFPGCLIPSLGALASAAAGSSRLMIHELDEIGVSYAETLRRWRANFHGHLGEVRALGYDERFVRTWDFYLAFCEVAFRTRALRDVQLTLTRAFNSAPCDALGAPPARLGRRARAARRALRDPAADAGRDRGRRGLGRSDRAARRALRSCSDRASSRSGC